MKITIPRKKILYIITKGNFGGAQRYVFDLAVSLPEESFEVAVAMGEGDSLRQKLAERNIRTIFIPTLRENRIVLPQYTDLRAFFALLKLFKNERPDIIHLNSSRAAILGALAARLWQLTTHNLQLTIKIVFTVHGWAFNEQRNIAVRSAIWLISAVTSLLANDVIVLSRSEEAQASFMPFARRKTRLIRNGITETEMLPRGEARELIAKNRCETLPRLWIGTIAELNRNKGIEYLIKAFAGLKSPATLCIIGNGEEKEELKALAEKLQIADSTIFAGFKEDAAKYLKAFDIFVLPSLKEGLSYSLLEAGTAGLPAVATSVGGIPEVISDMETGILVKPKDAKEISNALFFFMQNPEKCVELGGKLKRRISEEFSLSKMIGRTIAIYEGV